MGNGKSTNGRRLTPLRNGVSRNMELNSNFPDVSQNVLDSKGNKTCWDGVENNNFLINTILIREVKDMKKENLNLSENKSKENKLTAVHSIHPRGLPFDIPSLETKLTYDFDHDNIKGRRLAARLPPRKTTQTQDDHDTFGTLPGTTSKAAKAHLRPTKLNPKPSTSHTISHSHIDAQTFHPNPRHSKEHPKSLDDQPIPLNTRRNSRRQERISKPPFLIIPSSEILKKPNLNSTPSSVYPNSDTPHFYTNNACPNVCPITHPILCPNLCHQRSPSHVITCLNPLLSQCNKNRNLLDVAQESYPKGRIINPVPETEKLREKQKQRTKRDIFPKTGQPALELRNSAFKTAEIPQYSKPRTNDDVVRDRNQSPGEDLAEYKPPLISPNVSRRSYRKSFEFRPPLPQKVNKEQNSSSKSRKEEDDEDKVISAKSPHHLTPKLYLDKPEWDSMPLPLTPQRYTQQSSLNSDEYNGNDSQCTSIFCENFTCSNIYQAQTTFPTICLGLQTTCPETTEIYRSPSNCQSSTPDSCLVNSSNNLDADPLRRHSSHQSSNVLDHHCDKKTSFISDTSIQSKTECTKPIESDGVTIGTNANNNNSSKVKLWKDTNENEISEVSCSYEKFDDPVSTKLFTFLPPNVSTRPSTEQLTVVSTSSKQQQEIPKSSKYQTLIENLQRRSPVKVFHMEEITEKPTAKRGKKTTASSTLVHDKDGDLEKWEIPEDTGSGIFHSKSVEVFQDLENDDASSTETVSIAKPTVSKDTTTKQSFPSGSQKGSSTSSSGKSSSKTSSTSSSNSDGTGSKKSLHKPPSKEKPILKPSPVQIQPQSPLNQSVQSSNNCNPAQCAYGYCPPRSTAFKAPIIKLRDLEKSYTANFLSSEYAKDLEEDGCLNFAFSPRPDYGTEVTFQVEPRRQPIWKTMMRCGFVPIINCGMPPCCLPASNQGIKSRKQKMKESESDKSGSDTEDSEEESETDSTEEPTSTEEENPPPSQTDRTRSNSKASETSNNTSSSNSSPNNSSESKTGSTASENNSLSLKSSSNRQNERTESYKDESKTGTGDGTMTHTTAVSED